MDPIRPVSNVRRAPFVPPVARVAPVSQAPAVSSDAERLGVEPGASQREIDERFRAIVRDQRPDLGTMSTEAFTELVAARKRLLAGARARSEQANAQASAFAVGRTDAWSTAPTLGTRIDLDA
jgi:hypothetical protein